MIGFGITEQDFERAEEEAFREFVSSQYAERGLDFFTDEFVQDVKAWMKARATELRKQAKIYKSAETFPDRYTQIFPTIIADVSHIVAIIKFHHINRRHALSPDGWALMQSERIFYVRALDLDEERRVEAA